MKIYPVNTGYFKLDGGAMFGVVPKVLWQRTNPADENNQIEMALRCLLVEDGDRLILIDTGIGDKQSEKFFGHFHLYGDDSLDKSLRRYGFHRDDITDVLMTHLHFDHCGGAIVRNKKGFYEPAFPRAKYWSNEAHWKWATEPNAREKASFLPENILPIQESGQLNFIPHTRNPNTDNPLNMEILFVDGHTEKQMIPIIRYQGKTLVFMADFLPTAGHIPLPYIMGYDTRPLITLKEKEKFLSEAAGKGYYLFLEHDAYHEICTVKHTEKGVRLDKTFNFDEIFN